MQTERTRRRSKQDQPHARFGATGADAAAETGSPRPWQRAGGKKERRKLVHVRRRIAPASPSIDAVVRLLSCRVYGFSWPLLAEGRWSRDERRVNPRFFSSRLCRKCNFGSLAQLQPKVWSSSCCLLMYDTSLLTNVADFGSVASVIKPGVFYTPVVSSGSCPHKVCCSTCRQRLHSFRKVLRCVVVQITTIVISP